uniref:Uncharacterized protein n=1 Tax=Oryzias latipes TaxID=8090 RepID=A0A3B3HYD3_ORYLA
MRVKINLSCTQLTCNVFNVFIVNMTDTHQKDTLSRCLCIYEQSRGGGVANICLNYECEVRETQRRPASLLDALQREDSFCGDSGTLGHRLSTLALQNDKRMEDELRGGKRKIKLVQHQVVRETAKLFLADMKKSLSKVNFDRIVQALQTYKKTDELDVLLTGTAVLSEDANTHSLLRGFYQFVRPHHKRRFDERCEQLTGQGCGYKPEHSLSKDQKKAVMLRGGASSSAYSQLDTQQLNRGGQHLSQGGLKEPQAGEEHRPAQKLSVSSGVSDRTLTLGAERCARLSDAISNYKKTDNYEDLVTTVVSLFTERDDNFQLLTRFSLFIHPHHKKKYKELLDALMGQQTTPTSGELIFLTDFISSPWCVAQSAVAAGWRVRLPLCFSSKSQNPLKN